MHGPRREPGAVARSVRGTLDVVARLLSDDVSRETSRGVRSLVARVREDGEKMSLLSTGAPT